MEKRRKFDPDGQARGRKMQAPLPQLASAEAAVSPAAPGGFFADRTRKVNGMLAWGKRGLSPIVANCWQGGSKVRNLLSPLALADAVASPDSPASFAADIEEDGR